MNKEIVTKKVALLLKDLNFNQPVRSYYEVEEKGLFSEYPRDGIDIAGSFYRDNKDDIALAPTWFQTIDWVRETHKLHFSVDWYEGSYYWRFRFMNKQRGKIKGISGHKIEGTYFETLQDGIINMLEYIKETNNGEENIHSKEMQSGVQS